MADTFGNPELSDQILDDLQNITEGKQPAYPWDILESMEEMGYERKEARKALRKLHISNHIVPAEPFVGEIRLAERY